MRRCVRCAAGVEDEATACARCGAPAPHSEAETAMRERLTPDDVATAVRVAMPSDAESSAKTELEGAAAKVLVRDPDVGRVVGGRYEIQDVIGAGGMGRVYKVRHVELDTLLCLKKLKSELAGRDQADTLMQRFRAEAKLTSRLNHPNIIKVVDFGADADGSLYYVMEYVEGADLDELLGEEFALTDDRVLRITEQILDALAEAHAQRVVHRDLKPKNVMIERRRSERDFVRVLDFGIAKVLGESKLTQTGHIVGTAHYMSPEQAMGLAIDQRSDLYAVGVMLYEMATGALPYDAETPTAVLFQHVNLATPLPRTRRADIPERLEKLILRALEKDPKKRPQTAEEFRDEVRVLLGEVRARGEQQPRRRDGRGGATQQLTRPDPPPAKKAWVKPAIASGAVGLAAIVALAFSMRTPAPVPTPAADPPPVIAAAPAVVAPPPAPAPTAPVAPPPEVKTVPPAPPAAEVARIAPVVAPVVAPTLEKKVVSEPVVAPDPVASAIALMNGRMVKVAGASASPIGCADAAEECSDDEKPRIAVALEAFRLDRAEVTTAEFKQCVDAGACTRDDSGPGCRPLDQSAFPVNCVTWEQAQAFCRWRGARLPSEFEWERAARGDTDRRYPWGDSDPDCTRAQFSSGDLCPEGGARPAGSHPTGRSPFGVEDLAGNVKEWTADWYSSKTYAMGAPAKSGDKKVVRGGSFENGADKLRATYRIGHAPAKAFASVGFRCAK